MSTDEQDLPTLPPDDASPPSPHDDAPIAEQEPLGSGQTSDSPSDLPAPAKRDPQAPPDAGVRRTGDRDRPPRDDVAPDEASDALGEDLDEDEDPDLGFIDDARQDAEPDDDRRDQAV